MNVESQVIQIIAEQGLVPQSSVGMTTEIESLGLDSMSIVDILYTLEETFDITIPYDAKDPAGSDFKLTNVGEVARSVERLIARREAS